MSDGVGEGKGKGEWETYVYQGVGTAASLMVGGQVKDVVLHTGAQVSLPASHQFVQTLLAQGLLVKAAQSKPEARAKVKSNKE